MICCTRNKTLEIPIYTPSNSNPVPLEPKLEQMQIQAQFGPNNISNHFSTTRKQGSQFLVTTNGTLTSFTKFVIMYRLLLIILGGTIRQSVTKCSKTCLHKKPNWNSNLTWFRQNYLWKLNWFLIRLELRQFKVYQLKIRSNPQPRSTKKFKQLEILPNLNTNSLKPEMAQRQTI